MMELAKKLFFKLSDYKQPAEKAYDVEVLKHISTKMIEAIFKKNRICIFGDADADGIFSSMEIAVYLERLALIYRKKDLESGNFIVDIEYSDKAKDGFGLNEKTYKELSDKYDLIITTDNGTSSPFLTKEINNLIVIDHHPLNDGEKLKEGIGYVFNPNAYRTENFYSTSGGMVVLDVIKFIERVLKDKEPHFKEYMNIPSNYKSHEVMMEVLSEYAGFTIVSDMAVLDKYHREHLLKTLSGVAMKQDIIPLYTQFNREFTQTSLSFNLIPKINIHRMEALRIINTKFNRTYMEGFVRPKTKTEFSEALKFISEIDLKKKKMVQEATTRATKEVDAQKGSLLNLCILDDDNYKVGIAGLIANKLLQKSNKISIVGIVDRKRDKISFSGRGENVKSVMMKILKGNGGGHQHASGGKMDFDDKNIDINKLQQNLITEAETFISQNLSLFKRAKTEIIHSTETPLTIQEVYALSKELKESSQCVNYHKPIRVSTIGFDVHAINLFKSGEWGGVSFSKGKYSINEILFNAIEFPPEALKNAKAMILELGSDGKFSIHSIYDSVSALIDSTVVMKEAEEFNIRSSFTPSINANTLKESTIKKTTLRELQDKGVVYIDELGLNRYTQELDIDNISIDDATIVIPAFTDEKKFRHTKTLDVFVAKGSANPFTEEETTSVISNFIEFAKRFKSFDKNSVLLLPEKPIYDHPLLKDNHRYALQTIMDKNIYIENKKDLKTNKQIKKEKYHETDINTTPNTP